MKNNNLSKLYKIRFAGNDLVEKNKIWKIICSDYIQKFVKVSDTVVDIACGYGEFSNNIIAKRKIAIDLNEDARSFLSNEVEFYQCSANNISSIINGSADVIFTSNFLEHLPNKQILDDFLDQILMALKPGGKYLIMGPNLRYLPGKYWDFYDHSLGLTHLSLSEALRLKGFSIDICVDRFLPYTIQSALPRHPILVKIYLKIPFVWRLLGKQFFIVARKS
jgi:SAM-dependent methyltransferase